MHCYVLRQLTHRAARVEAEEMKKDHEFHMGPACETASLWEYQSNIRKCKSSKRAPPQKYIAPITAQQEVRPLTLYDLKKVIYFFISQIEVEKASQMKVLFKPCPFCLYYSTDRLGAS